MTTHGIAQLTLLETSWVEDVSEDACPTESVIDIVWLPSKTSKSGVSTAVVARFLDGWCFESFAMSIQDKQLCRDQVAGKHHSFLC